MLTEKQRLLFESLKEIKDTWIGLSVASFNYQSKIKWADSMKHINFYKKSLNQRRT